MIKIKIADTFNEKNGMWVSLPLDDEQLKATWDALSEKYPDASMFDIVNCESDMSNIGDIIVQSNLVEDANLLAYTTENMTAENLDLFNSIVGFKEFEFISECITVAALVKGGDYEVWNGITDIQEVGKEYLRRDYPNLPEILFANLNYEGVGMDVLEGEGGDFVDGRYIRNINIDMVAYADNQYHALLATERHEYEDRQAQQSDQGMSMSM